MTRKFEEWWKSLPNESTEENENKKPHLSHVNYIWVTNVINNVPKEMNPTVEELLEWIKS